MTGQFVWIKRCTNCGANNPPTKKSCYGCGTMFIEEMDFEAWTNKNNIMQTKRKEKEDQKKKDQVTLKVESDDYGICGI